MKSEDIVAFNLLVVLCFAFAGTEKPLEQLAV